MRKLVIAALIVFVLGCFSAASTADACDNCQAKCGSKCSQNTCSKCETKCKPKCNTCQYPAWDVPYHPYQDCFTGSGILCDQGCGGGTLPCKRQCITCQTICTKSETIDPCTGCKSVSYCNETVCVALQRPTVIPWWFAASEGQAPVNVYSENDEQGTSDDG